MLQDLSVSVSCRLYVSVLQAQTVSHIAGYIKVSVFCKLSKCQYVASSNSVSVLHALKFVSVLQALTMSVCCTHKNLSVCCKLSQCQCVAGCQNVSVLQALTVSACCTH